MATFGRQILRVSPETSTLLICDVQERFRPLIHNMRTVISKSELLNNACNLLEIPCAISEQNPRALGTTVPEITRHPNQFIYSKTKFSMVTDEISKYVEGGLNGPRKQFILCGIESHVCVFQTAMDLYSKGLDVVLVCDAVSSQRPYDRAIALENLKRAGVHLTTTESLIFELMKDSVHPKFREISKMIKANNESCLNEFLPSYTTA